MSKLDEAFAILDMDPLPDDAEEPIENWPKLPKTMASATTFSAFLKRSSSNATALASKQCAILRNQSRKNA